jgi:hypothetical protein
VPVGRGHTSLLLLEMFLRLLDKRQPRHIHLMSYRAGFVLLILAFTVRR